MRERETRTLAAFFSSSSTSSRNGDPSPPLFPPLFFSPAAGHSSRAIAKDFGRLRDREKDIQEQSHLNSFSLLKARGKKKPTAAPRAFDGRETLLRGALCGRSGFSGRFHVVRLLKHFFLHPIKLSKEREREVRVETKRTRNSLFPFLHAPPPKKNVSFTKATTAPSSSS